MAEDQASTPLSGKSTITSAFRNRNFLRLYLAGATSTSGQTIAGVAIAWIVFEATGSALAIALVGIVRLAASILTSLPAGVWVDRYNRKLIMVYSDITRAALIGGLALVFFLLGFNLGIILIVLFVVSSVSTLFTPAQQSILPAILPKEQLADANGVIQSSNWLISSISSSVAGAIVLVSGVVLSLLYNTLTFAISAVLVFTVALAPALATPKAVGKPVAKPKMTREIVEGWRWLISSKGLFQLSISALFLNFFSTIFGAFVVVYVVLNLQGTALTYGIFLATMTLGGALGTLLVGRTSAVKNAGKVWILVYGVMGGGLLIVMGWTHLFWVAVPTVFVYSMGTAFAGNTWLTCAQTIVPENMRGRYFSLDGLLSYGVLPASQLAGGLLITLRGITFTVELAGLGLLVCGALSLLGRALWNLDGTVEPVPY